MANPFKSPPKEKEPTTWDTMRAEDDEARGSFFGKPALARMSSSGGVRSSSAVEGIELLKKGCVALKADNGAEIWGSDDELPLDTCSAGVGSGGPLPIGLTDEYTWALQIGA